MRPIDADAFIEDIKTEAVNLYLDGMKGTPRPYRELYDIIDRIGEQPTIDAVPVVHGQWLRENIRPKSYLRVCSMCKKTAYFCGEGCSYKYCPNCGARMDGGAEA